MHEVGIAAEIYRISREAAGAGARLQGVVVAVGELSAVEPDLLEFAWQAVVSGSRDEAVPLTIEWRFARQSCARCGVVSERAEGSWLKPCPRCGDPLSVTGGDDLDVLRVSFEPESEGAS